MGLFLLTEENGVTGKLVKRLSRKRFLLLEYGRLDYTIQFPPAKMQLEPG